MMRRWVILAMVAVACSWPLAALAQGTQPAPVKPDAAVAAPPAPAPVAAKPDPALEAATKAIVDNGNKVKSVSATLGLNAQMPGPNQNQVPLQGSGTIDFLKKDGKPLGRVDLSVRSGLPNASGTEMAHVLAVSNGDKAAALVTFFGTTRYFETDVGALNMTLDPQDAVNFLTQNGSVKVLPEEKVGDRDAYVLEGSGSYTVPLGQMAVQLNTVKIWFDKSCGVPLQVQVYGGPAGGQLVGLTLSGLTVDGEIPADRFTLPEPPPPPPAPPAAPAAAASPTAGSAAPKPAEKPAAEAPKRQPKTGQKPAAK